MLNYKRNELNIEGVSVKSLAEKFGTPLFIYSKSKVIENFGSFKAAFKGISNIICYAVKANSNNAMLKELAKLGAGADVTSGGEIYLALRAGFKPNRIVYAGIGKFPEEIEYALKNNILMFNVESIEELQSINSIAGKLKKKARIAFRINPNVDAHTHKYITTGKSGSKFGIPYEEVVGAYKIANGLKNIEVTGIHCHIGSQITEIQPFKMAALRIFRIVKRLASIGIKLEYVDLGGGLGIQYRNEAPPTPIDLAKSVVPLFKGMGVTLVFEPGRYIAGNAGILVTKVIYRKKSGGKEFFIVDGGMNDLIRPTLYEAYHDIVPVAKSSSKKIKVDIVGPICETGDFLGKARILPKLNQGDFLVVKCAGAYGFAMSSQYNSRLRAAEVIVDKKKAKLVTRREEYRDLVCKEKK